MEFFYDKKWNFSIKNLLKNIDAGIEILILNKSKNEYLQVLFTDNGFIVEIRLILNQKLLRQFRIGKNPLENVWIFVNSTAGPIGIKTSEKLTKADVEELTLCYFENLNLDDLLSGTKYYRRNISREIGLVS